MSDSVNTPVAESLHPRIQGSAWTPLGEPLFRSLWLAAVISYVGTWMQNVGAGWLMTQLTTSPLMVSLVTAATTLPVFLVILPAAAALLGILTLRHEVTPWVLLVLTFVLGLGAVMNDPAWQAITPEIVSAQSHEAAVALNSVGFNVARAIGPALGGLVIAAAGSGVAFLLNAASFFGVIFFLYRWKRPHYEHVEKGRVTDAMLTGLRFVRDAPVVRCVLIRTGAFSLAASSMPALLPILARPHGATGYGLLMGSFGLGALAGAAALPRLRSRLSVDGLVVFGTLLFAAMSFMAGRVETFPALSLVLFTSGIAWIGILACLNVAAQTMSPPWLRARALSMYLLVLQGGMALGSAVWGGLATRVGVPSALLYSSVALVAGLFTVLRYRLTSQGLRLAPAVVRD